MQQDYGWGCELLRYEYRRQIKGNLDFSDDFLTKIHLFIQDTAVVHHDHVSGKIFGRAHDSCNKAVQLAIKTLPICVFAHNANKFDIKFIIAGINLSEWGTANINLIGKSSASVESVQICYEVVFRDSSWFQLLSNDMQRIQFRSQSSYCIRFVEHKSQLWVPTGNILNEIVIRQPGG